MMRRRSWVLLAGASLIACSSTDSGAPSPEDGGSDVVTATPDAGDSDAQPPAVVQTVGAAGGTVSDQGVSLTIPAGALPGDVQISITESAAPVPSGYTRLSPVFRFEPSGTVFLTPATVDLTLTGTGANPTMFLSNSGGGFDALTTNVTVSSASAKISRLGDCFVGVGMGGDDGGTEASNPMADAGPTDSGSMADAGQAESGSVADAGPTDSGPTPDSGPTDSGLPADSGPKDAAMMNDSSGGDAGVAGISVTIDGVPTTFAANVQPSLSGPDTSIPDSIIQADDNATTTHWRLQLIVTGAATQSCVPYQQPTYPQITYTHYTGGTLDTTFSSHAQIQAGNTCSVTLVGSPAMASGDHARGSFTGTVVSVQDAGASHVLSAGSYDETIP
jgi:ZU5 domain-containing protein